MAYIQIYLINYNDENELANFNPKDGLKQVVKDAAAIILKDDNDNCIRTLLRNPLARHDDVDVDVSSEDGSGRMNAYIKGIMDIHGHNHDLQEILSGAIECGMMEVDADEFRMVESDHNND